ncbi:MAG: hypothetical protein ACXWPM_12055 [Bdellovibrionota bacterium]
MLHLLLALLSPLAQAGSLKTVSDAQLIWPGVPGRLQARFEVPPGWSDAGEYTRFTLKTPGHADLVLDKIQGDPVVVSTDAKNVLKKGKYLELLSLDQSRKHLALALTLWNAPDSDFLVLISLGPGGNPYIALKKPLNADYFKLRDYNDDGLLDLVLEGGHGEDRGQDLKSYDPYLVYTAQIRGGRLHYELDEKLSEKWSGENHFQWHGPKYDGKIHVHGDGTIGQ